uniref:Uncharacterized protein n=1 Tax=Spongospora subterranea TaxID=70186 RepID=A0A0H5RAE8_9EUKA|eukprot:CRZ05409.1 hypothetical protein [Spongospora subterranea]
MEGLQSLDDWDCRIEQRADSVEERVKEAVKAALGEQYSDCADQAVASITLQLKTMSALVTLFPIMTSSYHAESLMKKYSSSCLAAIQNASRSILQIDYCEGLSKIPEDVSVEATQSPLRTASPNLKIPQLRPKASPRRQLIPPKTRRSLQAARRKSCDSEAAKISFSASSISSPPGARHSPVRNLTLYPKANLSSSSQPRRPVVDVSRSVDFSSGKRTPGNMVLPRTSSRTSGSKKPALARPQRRSESGRRSTGATGRFINMSPSRISQEGTRFDDSASDVSRSVDWSNLSDRSTSSCGDLNPQGEPDTAEINSTFRSGAIKKPSSLRNLAVTRLSCSNVQPTCKPSLRGPLKSAKENEMRHSAFLQNVEELVAKASPYSEVFATRTKIGFTATDDEWH